MRPTHTLVLTAAPGSGAVMESVTRAAAGAFDAPAFDAAWLSPGAAWELPFAASSDVSALPDAMAAAIGDPPIDINVVAGTGPTRRKRLLCADMESTIIEQELIDEIAKLAGRHEEITAITAAAMRGELNFEASLVRRVALFEGLVAAEVQALLSRVTLMPGAETLARTMRSNGSTCALVSGGFTLFAEAIAERVGFDAVVANVLEIDGGRLTGKVRAPILGPEGKAEALRKLAGEFGLDASDTLAVGDGANDTRMLAAAGLGVAFRAKPILATQARNSGNGAVIAHGDLTALLYLQGYTRDEFVR
ncbi:phosphoserine phosphatase SerB [Hyphomicrobium sp.]|uniref:phosphoserine phosphatase SerB n=1 Tax=Hyphomicrobium sp. TaxID=82 RepID=UPI002E317E7D|nr:phosphoserine phosphatase SerB [Hyphomicrobium sp.]HEX2841221.1 phosphoserine phosphatase SerB [Hyphomicrobium sp.]